LDLAPHAEKARERRFRLIPALESQTGRIIPWLFHRDGNPIKDFRATRKTACKAAGVPGRIPHDFRRTAVRNLERAGVSRSAAMAMTGHLTESVYRRYAVSDETSLKEAAAKLAALHDAGRLSTNVRSNWSKRGQSSAESWIRLRTMAENPLILVVPRAGLEPACGCPRWILSFPRRVRHRFGRVLIKDISALFHVHESRKTPSKPDAFRSLAPVSALVRPRYSDSQSDPP